MDGVTPWLAGLLEGEGHFAANPKRGAGARAQLMVTLAMTDKDVIERAAAIDGLNVLLQERPEWKTIYRCVWTGRLAEALMYRVLPYMGARRKAKIVECLSQPLSHHPRPIATRCRKGLHSLDGNVIVRANGKRECRSCINEGQRRRRRCRLIARQKATAQVTSWTVG